MASSTINGFPVMQGRVQRPRVGNWVAELVVDAAIASQIPQGSAAQLVIDDNALSFSGTVLRGGSYAANVTLRLVGGSNGLSTLTTPRFYSGVQVSGPLHDVLSDANYALSSASMPAALNTALQFWTLVEQPAAQALTLLANSADDGCVWRVQPDGTLFFGADSFAPSALVNFDLIEYMPLEGIQVLAAELPAVNPGESFSGFNISVVEHLLGPEASRIRLMFE
jgi:hypothetical protein